ncbi:type VI secretion system baseplate subunit TssE [Vibrio sp. S4M6]|uniref:type VI secretion system baseplate subunit TssE n=1 Tax=Vibrio sinus TaxID=2946865 RepID=UPI00202A7CDC|nr:type VI secretion system baseplate subunit TssE [Vibrio sinus]MCL9782502.1 type VI secretion system baseplate subunit TssE [Vibrio sinus]
MYANRLLERVRQRSTPQPVQSNTDKEQLSLCISRYLVKLLNTQQGSSQACLDFGMPDLNDYRYGEGLQDVKAFEQVIVDTIKRYEPRVYDVDVRFIPQQSNPLGVVFHINTQVRVEREQVALAFETVLGADGRIRVDEI